MEIEVVLHSAVGHAEADDGLQLLRDGRLLGIDLENWRWIVGKQEGEARRDRVGGDGMRRFAPLADGRGL